MFVYLSVFAGKVLLITEPIWFSITVKILIGPEKFYNYLGVRFLHPSKINRPYTPPHLEKIIFTYFFKTKVFSGWLTSSFPNLKSPLRPLGAYLLVSHIFIIIQNVTYNYTR